jgi:hypothetical protein
MRALQRAAATWWAESRVTDPVRATTLPHSESRATTSTSSISELLNLTLPFNTHSKAFK